MSRLRQAAHDYLAMRRALGYKLQPQGRLLLQFITYLEDLGAQTVTVDAAVAWARQPACAHPVWWNNRLSAVRGFARHLGALDPATEVPPYDVLPRNYQRKAPHLFSEAETAALVHACQLLATPLQAATFRALIGLLVVSGMRVGEAVGLNRDHVDLDAGTVIVVKSKMDKSRLLPLHPTTIAALRDYVQRRDHLLGADASAQCFFASRTGHRLSVSGVDDVFACLLHHAGIEPVPGRRPPRVHDLRHSFAVTTLLEWYRTGKDVQALLPSLSTYLGHVGPSSTYWYLQAVPELLSLAASRLEPDQASQESP